MKPLPDTPPPMSTERLLLRPLRDGDIAALFAIYGDAEVMRYASDDTFPNPSTVLTMLASVDRLLVEGASIEWAIEDKRSRELIGTCGFHSFDAPNGCAEVGCMLARNTWGQGFMREALRRMFAWARHELGLASLRADIDAANLRSMRLFAALGFARIDTGTCELALSLADAGAPAEMHDMPARCAADL